MMRVTPTLLCCTLLALLSGCIELDVPEDRFVLCHAGGAACPDGFSCNEALGRCVPVGSQDVTPPGLVGEASLLGTPARADGTLSVSFTVDEELAADSRVYLDVDGVAPEDRPAFALQSTAGLVYTWVHVVTDEDPEGSYPSVALLADRWGNSTSEPLGQMTIDRTAPRVTGLARDGAKSLGEGGEALVSFAVSETLGEPPVVRLGSIAMLQDASVTPPDYRYRYAVVAGDAPGWHTLSVGLADLAGNPGSVVEQEFFSFDFEAPQILNALVEPPLARQGTAVQVQVTLSEAVQEPPVLQASPAMAFTWQGASANIHSFQHLVVAEDAVGEYALTLDVIDEAGNPATGLPVGSVLVDGTPPVLADFELTPDAGSRLSAGAVIRLSLDVTEAGGLREEYPLVSLGDERMIAVDPPDAGWDHSFRYTVLGTEAEGIHPVVVDLLDVAGNQTVQSVGSFVLDFDPPGLVSTRATPAAARLDDVIYYDVTPDEALGPAPELSVTGAASGLQPAGFFTHVAGTLYKFEHTVVAGEDDDFAVLVTLEDEAGNPAPDLAGAGFTIDGTAPQISGVTMNGMMFSAESGHDEVLLSFDCSDNLDAAPAELEATLGGAAMSCDPYQAASPNYTCRFTVTGGPGDDGPRNIHLRARDAAGNEDLVSRTVSFDFTAPVVSGVPYLERCDQRQSARVTLDEIWARREYDCAPYLFDPDDCVNPQNPVEAPLMLGVAMSEAVDADTRRIFLQGGAGDLVINTCASSESYLVGMYVPDGTEPETAAAAEHGTPVMAHVEDLVGNAADLNVGWLRFDFSAPAVPDTATADRIVFTRAPWGSAATAGVPAFTVRGIAGAVEPNAAIRVLDGPAAGSDALLGRGDADANGAFGDVLGGPQMLDLAKVDVPTVYLMTLDAAGNPSDADANPANGVQAVEVKDIEWIATMGGKQAGSTFENPHVYEARGRFTPNLVQTAADGMVEVGGEQGMAAPGGDVLTSTGASVWTDHTHYRTSSPSSRFDGTMVYDSARGQILLFGGRTSGSRFGDTWAWRNHGWTQVASGGPAARSGCAMAYDERRGRVVLYGGETDVGLSAELWEWDGEGWIRMAAPDPGPRTDAAMAYDVVRQQVLMFGGNDGADDLGDTWGWDGAAWSLLDTGGPAARSDHAMTTDFGHRQVVLHGGLGVGMQTWVWNGSAWQPHALADAPGERRSAALVYDRARGRVVLYGGEDAGGSPQSGLYEWDGDPAHGWTAVAAGGPFERSGPLMAYDAVAEAVVMFGGYYSGGMVSCYSDAFYGGSECGGTWLYAGSGWAQTLEATDPPGRVDAAMAYDAFNETVAMHAGYGSDATGRCDGNTGGNCSDDWDWNGRGWTNGSGYLPRKAHAMAYDPVGKQLLLFGGYYPHGNCDGDSTNYCDSTYARDSAGNWQQISTTGPDARHQHAMVYDDANDQLVVFGGQDGAVNFGDTWVWKRATGWSEVSVNGPEKRQGAAMAFDSARGVTVLFGGSDWPPGGSAPPYPLYGDTWEWDGDPAHDWVEAATTGPEPRFETALAYDSDSQRVVLFGGRTEDWDRFSDTWEWDGVVWRVVSGAGPASRSGHAMAYNAARGRVFLFSGELGGSTPPDLWEYDGGGKSRPAQVMRAAFSAAGQGAPFGFERLSFDALAAGVGRPGGVATHGAELRVWDEGAWRNVDTNSGDPAAYSAADWALSWSTADASEIARLLFGDGQTFNFAVVAAAPGGAATASERYGKVAVDHAELTVAYRRP